MNSERMELIEHLERYRKEFAMSYDSGIACDRLIAELKAEEADSDE